MQRIIYGDGAALIVPDNLDDEIRMSDAVVNDIIEFPNVNPGQVTRVKVIDRIICLKVEVVLTKPKITTIKKVPKNKLWNFIKYLFRGSD